MSFGASSFNLGDSPSSFSYGLLSGYKFNDEFSFELDLTRNEENESEVGGDDSISSYQMSFRVKNYVGDSKYISVGPEVSFYRFKETRWRGREVYLKDDSGKVYSATQYVPDSENSFMGYGLGGFVYLSYPMREFVPSLKLDYKQIFIQDRETSSTYSYMLNTTFSF